MNTLETKTRFIELRARGYSFDKIAKELGKAKQTLIDWSKDMEEEIANLKALELEAMYESYHLQRTNRLQGLGELLRNIREELVSRDLSEVPTDKLMDLFLKYNGQIAEETIEPVFRTSSEITEEREDKRLLEELTTPQHHRLKVG